MNGTKFKQQDASPAVISPANTLNDKFWKNGQLEPPTSGVHLSVSAPTEEKASN